MVSIASKFCYVWVILQIINEGEGPSKEILSHCVQIKNVRKKKSNKIKNLLVAKNFFCPSESNSRPTGGRVIEVELRSK